MAAPRPALPDGFTVRVRDDVRRLPDGTGGEVLVGGSPLRALRLAAAARPLFTGRTLTVHGSTGSGVARRLLDGNLADPVDLDPARHQDVTVVVPVRDRSQELDRCLGMLAGLRTIVVDDASQDPAAVRAVAEAHGAEVVALDRNVGPAGARNAGLAHVRTPYVAFVDSDVHADPAMLCALAGHFADPSVALVAPLVRGRAFSARPRWFERYDEHASSLALGTRACSVRPGAAVGWLPSACLVGRTDALRADGVDGFDARLRVGEDVDLVWRLLALGETVRYDPTLVADHAVRTSMRAWLGRKLFYGSGGAELGRRHGEAIAPAVLSPAMALTGAALLTRRWWSIPLAVAGLVWARRSVASALPPVEGSAAVATSLALRGLGWSVRQEAALVVRHWWPAALAAGLVSRNARRVIATSLLVDGAVGLVEYDGQGLLVPVAGRRLDDLAYGAGLWWGAWRTRSVACLRPRLVGKGPGRWSSSERQRAYRDRPTSSSF
ncbi:mycofactocin biosynthesis glycosyltransferase MftF [Nocardioides sp. AN3]